MSGDRGSILVDYGDAGVNVAENRIVMRLDEDVKGKRLEAGRANFQVMRSWREIQVLGSPAEIIHAAGVVPVDDQLSRSRLDLQAKSSGGDVVGVSVGERPAAVRGQRKAARQPEERKRREHSHGAAN